MIVKELSPELLTHPEAALVVVNRMGATALADTGRDAQHLADRFGMRAFAVDRPGSGHVGRDQALREQLAADYVGAFEPLAKDLQARFEDARIEKVALVGRSAGTLGALALAATDDMLPTVKSIYGADGVAWRRRGIEDGKDDYDETKALQDSLLQGDRRHREFAHPHGPQVGPVTYLKRLVSMARSSYAEWNSYEVWASDTGLRLLERLAGTSSESAEVNPAIWLDIPEYGLTDDDDVVALRRTAPSAHIEVVTSPHTVHASFDNREFFAKRAKPAVDHLLTA
jgi:pimeloyl-ACP methyl ester carboxylesterase